MELRGDSVLLRSLDVGDVGRLAELGRHPDVARWWPDITEQELIEKAEGHGEVTALAIVVDGEVAGLIQYYEEDDPEYRHAGIDVFLSAELHGRGLGTDAVRTLADWLVRERAHHRLVIDPAAANTRAIRAYERAGFRSVGIMREHWRGPDGTWQDGLLMDLLARELD